MIDRRLLVAICAALIALASGVLALALDAPALGLVAGTGAVVAAGAAAVLTSRLRVAVPPRAERIGASEPTVSLDLAALEAQSPYPGAADIRDPFDGPPVERPNSSYLAHPSRGAAAEFTDEPSNSSNDAQETPAASSGAATSGAAQSADPSTGIPAPRNEGDIVGELADRANDPVSGLLGAPYFYAALDRGVASARRQLQPLSLVLFDLDGLDGSSDESVNASMEVLGAILRRTLRECDTACRTGHTTAAVLLEDTPETGAVWAAERVRGGLLARPDGDHLTVSAGVASYPSHALDATDLLQRAELALQSARNQGRDRVEIARSAD